MQNFRHPLTNKRIELSDEQDELVRHLAKEQGIFYYEAWQILNKEQEEQIKSTLLNY